MSSNLADRLEAWGFEGNFIIFSDGSFGFGLEVEPVDVSCWASDQINALSDKANAFLNGLPDGIDIQFLQEITSGNEKTLLEHESIAENSNNKAAKLLTHTRSERFRDLDQRGLLPKHSLKVFVRRPATTSIIDKPKLFSKTKKFEPIAEERLKRELQLTSQLQESITAGLKALDLSVTGLSSHQIIDLMYWQWNPTRPVGRAYFDPEDVRSSVLYTDAAIYERGFSLSDMHYRVVSLKQLPDQTWSALSRVLRDLPFDSRLYFSIHVPNQIKEIESLQTQRRLAFAMARGKTTGVSDLDSEAKLQDLETLLEQMIAQGEKVFQVSLNIVLRSKFPEELENQVAQTLSTIRSLSGAEGMEEGLIAFDLFSLLSIPHARCKERIKRMKTSNVADLLPIYGPWKGFQKPSVLLRSQQGSLFSLDPFSPDLTNANQLISGGSGAGKSFLTNILLLQMLKENPRVYFIDIGGSYKKLCENLSGQYVGLGVDCGLSINPFDLREGELCPSSEKIKFLVGLVELITKEDGVERLPKLVRAELEGIITELYKKNAKPKLSQLREVLTSQPDLALKSIGKILTPWCGDTPFGRFLDRDTTIELANSLIAFDLKGLESFPELQAVCLVLITDLVWREVQRDRGQMKFLVFDECWKLLKDDAALEFIESVFRTFRKYYASAIAISQDITDFANSKIAGAILPNCSIKWILMQNQSDPRRIQEILQLNESEMELISSLSQKKGIYSEAFLIAQKSRMALVIESTPLEYWIATTDPRDLAALDTLLKESPKADHLDALKTLSERYPHGIAAFEQQRKSA